MQAHILTVVSRNVTAFYWKSMNWIGSSTVDYSLIEHNHTHTLLIEGIIFLEFWPKNTKKLLVLNCNPLEFLLKQLDYLPSFSEHKSTWLCLVDYLLIENSAS